MLQTDDPALRAHCVRLAVLFGSRARGGATPTSDVDVGIVMESDVPGIMDPRRSQIAAALGVEGSLDLVFLDDADPLLLYEVASSGKPLFQRFDGAFEEFRVRAVKLYFDTEWIRRLEAEALAKRLS